VPVPPHDYDRLATICGVLNVLTGFAVAAAHAWGRLGARPALRLVALAVVVSATMELLGTSTGVPFGAYRYTHRLGPRMFGRVPLVLPLSWFMMIYPSLMMALAVARRRRLSRDAVPVIAAAAFALWDVALDPAATAGFACWSWETAGDWYAMPLTNLAGWLGTGWLIVAWFLRRSRRRGDFLVERVPESAIATRVPLALYAAQGVFASTLAAIVGRPGAALAFCAGFAALLAWRGLPSTKAALA
jgi:putative membrane protein